MDRVGMILLTVLLISASSSSTVEAKFTRYWTQFYETIPLPPQLTKVFQPLKPGPVPNNGLGYTKHNNVVYTSGGNQIGYVAGMFFYHAENAIEDIVTVSFSSNLTGVWSGSSINLRGLWRMNAEGNRDEDEQELSIVGGQGGFRGASGSVYYKRVASTPNTIFQVTCDIFVDKLKNSMPKRHVDLDTQFKSLPEAVKIQTPEILDVLKQVV